MNIQNSFFVILDRFDMNLDGSIQTRIIGVFDDFSIAKENIENLNLKNFRWLGKTRFKFSDGMLAHEGEIKIFPKNLMWIML